MGTGSGRAPGAVRGRGDSCWISMLGMLGGSWIVGRGRPGLVGLSFWKAIAGMLGSSGSTMDGIEGSSGTHMVGIPLGGVFGSSPMIDDED